MGNPMERLMGVPMEITPLHPQVNMGLGNCLAKFKNDPDAAPIVVYLDPVFCVLDILYLDPNCWSVAGIKKYSHIYGEFEGRSPS